MINSNNQENIDMKRMTLLLTLWLITMGCINASFIQENSASDQGIRWYRGNTHCHTLNSDGDSSPWEVAEWYKDHGYDFVVITDHNHLTPVDRLNAVYGEEGDFLVIPGVEVSERFEDKRVHLCALNPERLVLPEGSSTILNSLQNNVQAIRDVKGVPIIAHPNHRWSFGATEIKRVEKCRLFELFNGHPYINNMGWGEHQSTEKIWDEVLSSGRIVYGVAADDAHVFRDPWIRTKARPHQGWVMVEAKELSAEAIIEALDQGKFYSSTGIELENYFVDDKSVTVKVKQYKYAKYRLRFIGKNGQVFFETFDSPATYRFKGNETYIRVRIEDTNGNLAWTQPIEVGRNKK